jgi:hypothetical protein
LEPNLAEEDKNTLKFRGGQEPAIIRQLRIRLDNSSFKWNILVYEDPKPTVGSTAPTEYKQAVKNYVKQHRIPIAGHITFVFNSTSGHQLTPWIILHKIGHALITDKEANQLVKEVFAQFRVVIDEPGDVFTFKSARNRLGGYEELIRDSYASWLYQGHPGVNTTEPEMVHVERFLRARFTELTQKAVGKIVYDYFGGSERW